MSYLGVVLLALALLSLGVVAFGVVVAVKRTRKGRALPEGAPELPKGCYYVIRVQDNESIEVAIRRRKWLVLYINCIYLRRGWVTLDPDALVELIGSTFWRDQVRLREEMTDSMRVKDVDPETAVALACKHARSYAVVPRMKPPPTDRALEMRKWDGRRP